MNGKILIAVKSIEHLLYVLSTLCVVVHLILTTTYEMGTIRHTETDLPEVM